VSGDENLKLPPSWNERNANDAAGSTMSIHIVEPAERPIPVAEEHVANAHPPLRHRNGRTLADRRGNVNYRSVVD